MIYLIGNKWFLKVKVKHVSVSIRKLTIDKVSIHINPIMIINKLLFGPELCASSYRGLNYIVTYMMIVVVMKATTYFVVNWILFVLTSLINFSLFHTANISWVYLVSILNIIRYTRSIWRSLQVLHYVFDECRMFKKHFWIIMHTQIT